MTRKRWIFFGIIVIIMVIGGIVALTAAYFSDSETSTGNTLSGSPNWTVFYSSGGTYWAYRKPITITNSGTAALTYYQIKVTVPYIPNEMQTDYNDIRFTTSANALLPYWLESVSTTPPQAVFWVKVNSISASPASTTIYMYYGNRAASSLSNGYNTFILFDDFENGWAYNATTHPVTWTPSGNLAYSLVPSISAPHGSMYLSLTGTNYNYGISTTFLAKAACIIEYSVEAAQNTGLWELQARNGINIGPRMQFNNANPAQIQSINNNVWANVLSYNPNQWYSVMWDKITAASGTYDISVNGGTMVTGSRFDANTTYTSLDTLAFQVPYYSETTTGKGGNDRNDLIDANLTGGDGFYNGMTVKITSGELAPYSGSVTNYTASSHTLIVSPSFGQKTSDGTPFTLSYSTNPTLNLDMVKVRLYTPNTITVTMGGEQQ